METATNMMLCSQVLGLDDLEWGILAFWDGKDDFEGFYGIFAVFFFASKAFFLEGIHSTNGKLFGFLGSPYERECYLGAPDSNPKPPGPKPPIYQVVDPFWGNRNVFNAVISEPFTWNFQPQRC